MQVIDAAHTRAALPFDALIAALRAMFRDASCMVPARHHHVLPTVDITTDATTDGPAGIVLIMPAWQPGRYLGIKTVNIFPGNAQRSLPALHATYLLYDASSGVPLALIDGDEITARRTAAASALATSYLARADASRLLIVGAGRVARLLAPACRAVRPITRVQVWNRDPAGARALAHDLCDQGFAASVAPDLRRAVEDADIVSCATLATAPLIHGAWLRAGTHLDLIGGFRPDMRESDDDCLRRASVFVDSAEAVAKAGDLLDPIASGAFRADAIQSDLAGLCRGLHGGRRDAADITLIKSVGTALEDLAAAILVYGSVAPNGTAQQ